MMKIPSDSSVTWHPQRIAETLLYTPPAQSETDPLPNLQANSRSRVVSPLRKVFIALFIMLFLSRSVTRWRALRGGQLEHLFRLEQERRLKALN